MESRKEREQQTTAEAKRQKIQFKYTESVKMLKERTGDRERYKENGGNGQRRTQQIQKGASERREKGIQTSVKHQQ